jgi:NAD-dependent dihydropyrimidine dehydrogenase PreA subunit
MSTYEFPFATGKVAINYTKCQSCDSYACVKACSLFGRAILRVSDGKPVLISEDAHKRCIEDLACELYCQAYGNKGLNINLDMFGLEEYRHNIGME